MAKLPDSRSLGRRPTRQPQRQVTPIRNAGAVDSARAEELKSVAQTGAVINSVADEINAGAKRIRSRADAVARARANGDFGLFGTTELNRLETEDDLSSPGVLKSYGEKISAERDRLLAAHSGTPESKLRLEERLTSSRAVLINAAVSKSIDQSRKLVATAMGDSLNKLSAVVADDPSQIANAFKSLNDEIDDLAPALRPDQETSFRRIGRERLVETAIGAQLDIGEVDEAERILSDTPGISEIIGQTAQRRIFKRIREARALRNKGRNAGLNAIQEKQAILGRPLEPDERIELADVGSDLGRSLDANILERIATDTPKFAVSELTEDQERLYIAGVTHYTQPRQFLNPDTNRIETRRNQVPDFVREAFRARGIPLAAGISTELSEFKTDPDESALPADQLSETPPAPPVKTVFELAPLLTGPISSAQALIAKTPGLGGPFADVTQARAFVPLLQRELVRTLQNNPRYADAERQAIQTDIEIDPQIFDSPAALQDRIFGIDDALAIRFKNALQTASSDQVSGAERQHAMNVANALQNFRHNLLPPRMQTLEEAIEFATTSPAGTTFLAQNEAGEWVVYSANGPQEEAK